MAWFLFLLAATGVIAVFIWDYRRKTAAREAASRERFERIFKEPVAAASTTEPPPAVAPDTAVGSVISTAAAPLFPARERFLGPAETATYLLLKTGIPDHEIFANVSLASVVGAPGGSREREQRFQRLSQYRLDFVVCDRSMRIVAAIELEAASSAESQGTRRFISDCLSAGGVRLVRLSPAALPRREEIRALVCGSAA